MNVKTSVWVYPVSLALSISSLTALADAPEKLQPRFQRLAEESYRHILGQNAVRCDRLVKTIEFSEPAEPSQSVRYLACITQDQGHEVPTEMAARHLLTYGLSHPVEQWTDRLRADQRLESALSLEYWLARKALENHRWQEARNRVSAFSAQYLLSTYSQDYLVLMRGILLQKEKKHRKAIELYKTVTQDSPLFPVARANLAIAYLTQGWWTDAHREIDKLLNQPLQGEFHNRLHVIKGLSQLQQGFYRDARESFRSLDQDSQYVRKAWLGIGLAALHTQDFAGALNAFKQARHSNPSRVDESPFLLAFAHDQMGSAALAEASYTEAMIYYQSHIRQLDKTLNALKDKQLPDDLAARFRLPEPAHFLKPGKRETRSETPLTVRQYRHLQRLKIQVTDATLKTQLKELITDYEAYLSAALTAHLKQLRTQAQSYLSQCQYGLATIYDRHD